MNRYLFAALVLASGLVGCAIAPILPIGVDLPPSKAAVAEHLKQAEAGDRRAQYWMFFNVHDARRGEWLCKAAHGGHILAQEEMAFAYYRYRAPPYQGAPSRSVAQMWMELAARNHSNNAKQLAPLWRKTLTLEQAATADELLATWKPDPGSCR